MCITGLDIQYDCTSRKPIFEDIRDQFGRRMQLTIYDSLIKRGVDPDSLWPDGITALSVPREEMGRMGWYNLVEYKPHPHSNVVHRLYEHFGHAQFEAMGAEYHTERIVQIAEVASMRLDAILKALEAEIDNQ